MRISRLAVFLLAVTPVSAALAQDNIIIPFTAVEAEPLVLPDEAEAPITFTFDNSVLYDSELGGVLSSHEVTVDVSVTNDDVTLTASFWSGLTGDFSAGTLTPDFPTAEFGIGSDRWGTVTVWDASGALDNACVTPAAGSTHFGTEDLLAVSTCGGYADGKVLRYDTPSLNGFTVSVSAMDDLLGDAAAGDVDQSVAVAVAYEGVLGEATLRGSIGFDHATSIAGAPGDPLPTAIQAGVNLDWRGWTLGLAGQVEVGSADGDSRAAGVGVGKEVVEGLTVSAEIAGAQYTDAGDQITEIGGGATIEYALIPDRVLVDAGVNAVHRTGPAIDVTVYQVGAGVSVIF